MLKKKTENFVDKLSRTCCRTRGLDRDDDDDIEDISFEHEKKRRNGTKSRRQRRSSFVSELTGSTEKTPLLTGK